MSVSLRVSIKYQGFPLEHLDIGYFIFVLSNKQNQIMSIKKEFEKLVKEANQKIQHQNEENDAAQIEAFIELKKRQQIMVNILRQSQNLPQTKVDA